MLAEQAHSNATTARLESKVGSVTDPKYDKDANIHHPMHALMRAAVFWGGHLASQLAPGQEFGPGFVPAVTEVLQDPHTTETTYELGYIPKAAMVVHISRCRFDLAYAHIDDFAEMSLDEIITKPVVLIAPLKFEDAPKAWVRDENLFARALRAVLR